MPIIDRKVYLTGFISPPESRPSGGILIKDTDENGQVIFPAVTLRHGGSSGLFGPSEPPGPIYFKISVEYSVGDGCCSMQKTGVTFTELVNEITLKITDDFSCFFGSIVTDTGLIKCN
jgi:hypothetical protein